MANRKISRSSQYFFRSIELFAQLFWALGCGLPTLSAQISLDFFGGTNTNAIRLTGKSPISLTPRIHYLIGIQSGYSTSDRWALGLAAQYTVSGYGDAFYQPVPTTPAAPVTPTTDFRFHYLVLSPKVTFALSPAFKLSGGAYGGHLLYNYIREVNTHTWEPLDFGDFFSQWDFGVVTGFSIQYHRIFFFANYCWSLYPLASFRYTGSNGLDAGVARMYNRTFQVGFGCDVLKGNKKH